MKKTIKSIIITIIAIMTLSLSACSIFDKPLNKGDFDLNINNTLTAIVIEITPKVNIKTITYKVTCFDSNKKIVKEENYTQTNLSKNQTYKFTHDFGFTTMLNISSCQVTLIEGKQSNSI